MLKKLLRHSPANDNTSIVTEVEDSYYLAKLTKNSRQRTIQGYVIIACLFALIFLFFNMAESLKAISNSLDSFIEYAEAELTRLTDNVTESMSQLDNLEALNELKNALDVEALNDAISDLRDTLEPLANFVRLFN